jgi:hypothetical protein
MEAAGIRPDPPGLQVHVAFGTDVDLRVSEIWSSREQFDAYDEKSMPLLARSAEGVKHARLGSQSTWGLVRRPAFSGLSED